MKTKTTLTIAVIATSLLVAGMTKSDTSDISTSTSTSVTVTNTSVTPEPVVDMSVLDEPDTCSWDESVQQFLK